MGSAMDKEETIVIRSGVFSEEESQLGTDNEKKLKLVSDYYDERKNNVDKISTNVKRMNILQLLWDSKVPEKNKNFYYSFSLTPSNRVDVLEEIKKYQKFYEELSNAVYKVRNPEVQVEGEKADPHYEIILALNETLSNMYEEANFGKGTTASTTIYKLHKSFIQRHEVLENMIMRVESVVLKENFKKASDSLQNSFQRVNDLKSELRATVERSNKLSETAGELMSKINELPERHEDLLRDNEKLEELQKALKETNKLTQEEVEKLVQSNKEMGKEKEIVEEKNREMEKEQAKWQKDIKKMEEELENIRQNNLKMEEEQKALKQKNEMMPIEKEKLLQKYQEMKLEKEKLLQKHKEIEKEQENTQKENQKMAEELKMKRQIKEETDKHLLLEDDLSKNQMKRMA